MSLTFEQMPGAVATLLNQVENLATLLRISMNSMPNEVDSIMNIKEAAEFLGCSVSVLHQNKSIPRYKRLNKIYFMKSALIEWIKAGEVPVQEKAFETVRPGRKKKL